MRHILMNEQIFWFMHSSIHSKLYLLQIVGCASVNYTGLDNKEMRHFFPPWNRPLDNGEGWLAFLPRLWSSVSLPKWRVSCEPSVRPGSRMWSAETGALTSAFVLSQTSIFIPHEWGAGNTWNRLLRRRLIRKIDPSWLIDALFYFLTEVPH